MSTLSQPSETESLGNDVSLKKEEIKKTSITMKESVSQWFHAPSQEDAEKSVLQLVDVVRNPKPEIKTSINNIPITVSKEFVKTKQPLHLHEFAMESSTYDPASDKNLVIMHGYGAGLGLFYKNFDGLSNGLPGWNIYAVDWLGHGLSSRPKLKVKTADLSLTSLNDTKEMKLSDKDAVMVVKETEDWFIESLESWRQAKQLDKFTLMGHSMGGYLAAAYAFRYPEHVDKLIMVSPVGVERGYTKALDDRSFWSIFRSNKKQPEIIQAAPEVIEPKEEVPMSADRIAAAAVKPEFRNKSVEDEPKASSRLMTYIWNSHVSPFSIVRHSGVFGPRLMSNWSYWRFSQFPESELNTLHTYSYKTFSAKPSGEYAITRLLAMGALARMPLIDRVNKQLQCPSMWIYGDRDWMDATAGVELVENLNRTGNSNQKSEFHIVEKAGHHLYLDNAPQFNKLILNFLGSKTA